MADAQRPTPAPAPTTLADGLVRGYYITPTLDDAPGAPLKCLNAEAVFSLSSARPGNGVPQLLADSAAAGSALDSFWQSDGTAPHVISIQFRRRTVVSEVAFYVDAHADESYTPRTVAVRAGTLHHDLEELRRFDLHAPQGWVRVPLAAPSSIGDEEGAAIGCGLPVWYLQVIVHSMQANGRDMHMRAFHVRGHLNTAAPPQHAGAGVGQGVAGVVGGGTSLFDAPLGHGLVTGVAFSHAALHAHVR